MKIVLLEDVKGLGKSGEIKDVSEGYARNFLFPKNLARIGSEGAIKAANLKKEADLARQNEEKKVAREMAKKIGSEKITIKTKAKLGKLFGSITKKQIIDELKKKDLEVSDKCIIMKEAIKKTGEYEIEIRLSEEIKTKVKLEVSEE